MSNPQIYVACLAAYNNGNLHGKWIDVNQGVDAIRDEIQEMLDDSPVPGAEEWAIHDYSDMPDLGEYPDLNKVVNAAELVDQYSVEAVEAYVLRHGSDADLDDFEQAYKGKFKSKEDFAMEFASEIDLLAQMPKNLQMYFDWEAYARDLFINDFFEENGHVFSRD